METNDGIQLVAQKYSVFLDTLFMLSFCSFVVKKILIIRLSQNADVRIITQKTIMHLAVFQHVNGQIRSDILKRLFNQYSIPPFHIKHYPRSQP